MTTPASEITRTVTRVRLRAELALLVMLNEGFGYADPRLPAETYLRDDDARSRVFRLGIKPQGSHAQAAQSVATALAELGDDDDEALAALRTRFALSPAELAVFSVCAAYELDRDVRSLCHALSERRAPALYGDHCLELAYPQVGDGADLARALGPASPLGHLVDQSDRPYGAMRLSPAALAWLCGDTRLEPWLASRAELIATAEREPEPEDASIDAALGELRGALGAKRDDEQVIVAVSGVQGSGKLDLATALAASVNRDLLATSIPELDRGKGSLSAHFRAALLRARVFDQGFYCAGFETIHDKEQLDELARLLDLAGPLVVLAARRPGAIRLGARPHHAVSLNQATLPAREQAWTRELDELGTGGGDSDAADFARRYVVGPSDIRKACTAARAHADLLARAPQRSDVEAALAEQLSLDLGSFATRMSRKALWSEMVVPEEVQSSLRDMVAMVNERSRILEGWGYARHLGLSRGVSALFSGAPGTGKTMAASVISGELGLDLFRIDLSQVVSKWVGETEKHLARIFDEAQNAHAMLLFDEADSLFGKRTEVKSASDRYANLEVNYILQRMEQFDGVSILTTNLETALDAAFMRRLNFRIRFPEPDEAERLELWRRLLPPETRLSEAPELESLAKRFEMTGGYIRNAIVRAAVFAARQDRELMAADLEEGAIAEYYEMGKVMSSSLQGP